MIATSIETELTENINELVNILSALDQDQLNLKPFAGSWTAGQVGDHMLRSYGVVEVLKGNVKRTDRLVDQNVEEVRKTFLDFNVKFESPEFIIPAEIINKKALIKGLSSKRNDFLDIINTMDLSETCLDFSLPGFGDFTRLEWLYFCLFHTQRHLHQLKNIVGIVKENGHGGSL